MLFFIKIKKQKNAGKEKNKEKIKEKTEDYAGEEKKVWVSS